LQLQRVEPPRQIVTQNVSPICHPRCAPSVVIQSSSTCHIRLIICFAFEAPMPPAHPYRTFQSTTRAEASMSLPHSAATLSPSRSSAGRSSAAHALRHRARGDRSATCGGTPISSAAIPTGRSSRRPAATLSEEEQAFLDGPSTSSAACSTSGHHLELRDLPPDVWDFLKAQNSSR